MALNIQNRETEKLAIELARMTGESVPVAITKALRERINRLQGARAIGRAARLVKIGKQCAAHLHEPFRTADHAVLLYGEDVLPR